MNGQVFVEFKKFNLTVNGNRATFKGLLAKYGNQDRAGDILKHGAAKSADGTKVVLRKDHEHDIGIATLTETSEGVEAVGELNLDIEKARETKSLIEQFEEHGVPFGMSMGYQTKDADINWEDYTRDLKEVEIIEATVTATPANTGATITEIKNFNELAGSFKRIEAKLDSLIETKKAKEEERDISNMSISDILKEIKSHEEFKTLGGNK